MDCASKYKMQNNKRLKSVGENFEFTSIFLDAVPRKGSMKQRTNWFSLKLKFSAL